MLVDFVKMHGAGNDFILVDEWNQIVIPDKAKKGFVSKYCDRHFGVGADGVIFVQKSEAQDACFVFYNPDGSLAEMCGNGIRCFAKYVYEKSLVRKTEMSVETPAGVKTVKLKVSNGIVDSVTVNMGFSKVKFIDKEISAGGRKYRMTSVDMGNPHTVIFVDNADAIDVRTIGRLIRNEKKTFPKGVNVHFVEKAKENEFRIRTYERGVEDETLACGTGICASAVAAAVNKLTCSGKPVLFHALGGDVTVELRPEGKDFLVYMSGGANEVFSGSIEV
jgi:diaminopimelate epimerase